MFLFCRLQHENPCHVQLSQEARNIGTEASCSNNTLEERGETSHQQHSKEMDNTQFQPHSVERHPEGEEHSGGFSSGQTSDVPPSQSKHSSNTSDVSLYWFDSITDDCAKTEKGICERPIARTSQDTLTLKAPNNKSYSKDRNDLIETNYAAMEESLTRTDSGDKCRKAIVSDLDGKKKEKPPSFPSRASHKDPDAAFPTLPDLVITQRASKKWRGVNIEKSHGFCASTPNPTAGLAPFSPHPTVAPQIPTKDSNILPSHDLSVNQRLVTSIRKRSRDHLKEGGGAGSSDHEPEVLEKSEEKTAKLAKFLFRQKPKLARPSENENHARLLETISSPHSITGNVSKRERTRRKDSETCQKEHDVTNNNNSVGERPCSSNIEKEQQQTKVLSPSSTEGKGTREERAEGLSAKKVCSSTLARLAKFSFVPAPESKPEDPSSLSVAGNDKEKQRPPLKNCTEYAGQARKCFELGEVSKVTGKSLFSLADVDDAALDFDWDEEVKKKPRP